MKAAAHNLSDVCSLLIFRGADMEINETSQYNTALHLACVNVCVCVCVCVCVRLRVRASVCESEY